MIEVAEHVINIDMATEDVFAFAADLDNTPRWFPGIAKMESADALPPASVGKRYDEVARIPFRGETRIAIEVVESRADRHIAIHADLAPVLPRFDLYCVPREDGSTDVRCRCRARGTTRVAGIATRVMKLVLDRRVPQALRNLKTLLEVAPHMRAVMAREFGAAERSLYLDPNASMPAIGKRDVLVRVAASSVNPIDCMRRAGYGRRLFGLRGAATLPLLLGRDFVGEVVARGAKADRYQTGDLVWGAVDAFRAGAWAEYVAVAQDHVAPRPASLGDIEAASIPYVALTTWAALVGRAGLTSENAAGKNVLVHAGSGGVGSFAIQLLTAWGAQVATTCSTRNVGLVKELGASRVIDYTQERYQDLLRDMDLVFDTLGFDEEGPSLSVLARDAGAQYVSIVHPLVETFDRLGPILGALVSAGTYLSRKFRERRLGRGYHWALFSPNGAALERIGALVDEGRIRPVIDRTFSFDDMIAAHELVESRRARGKVVIRVEE